MLRASRGDWLIFTLGLREISSLQFTRPEDLYSPTLPENFVQGAAEPNTQMSAYPIFDKFGKLSGEKRNLEIGQDLTVLDPKHMSLLHTQYLEIPPPLPLVNHKFLKICP